MQLQTTPFVPEPNEVTWWPRVTGVQATFLNTGTGDAALAGPEEPQCAGRRSTGTGL
jgi:hypothetical protein